MLTIVGLTIVAVVCLAIGGALAWRQIDIPDFLGITIGTSVGALAGVLASK